MFSVHRDIIKSKHDILAQNVCFKKLEPLLKEYKMFNKYMWEDIETVYDVLDALPRRGPKAFQNIIEILRKAGYNQEADILEKPNLPHEIRNTDLYYKMSSKPLGYCLIINNMDFKDARARFPNEMFKDRKGSEVDAETFGNFLNSIDFIVFTEKNKKAEEMLNCIKEFSERNFLSVDSMILIILSHGGNTENKDYIYGTDGDKVFKENIYDFFSNEKCQELQNKPKIFFFIACRGPSRGYGVLEKTHNECFDSVGFYNSEEKILPILSDIYIFHATLPYHVSIRYPDTGSIFCETLVIKLKDYHQIHDLETIIKLVNAELKHKVSGMFRMVQVAHTENIGGSKKIMLCRTN